MNTGIYAGSFDPITFGHLDIIDRSMDLFDRVIIAVGDNADKKTMFSQLERAEMIEDAANSHWFERKKDSCKLEVIAYRNKYLFQLAKEYQNAVLIRGIRNPKDFEYELTLENFNRSNFPGIKTVYLSAPPNKVAISSSFVKSLVGYDGWESMVESYVTPCTFEKIKEKYESRNPRNY